MPPTPVPRVVPPPTTEPWVILAVVGVVVLLLIVGLVTGKVTLTPSKAGKAGTRGVLTMDALLFSGPERRAAIEYVLEEQDEVMLEQESGGGDDDEWDWIVQPEEHSEDGDALD